MNDKKVAEKKERFVGLTISSGSKVLSKKLCLHDESMSFEESARAIKEIWEQCGDVVEVDIKYIDTLKDIVDFYDLGAKDKEDLLSFLSGVKIARPLRVHEKEFAFAGFMSIPLIE